MFPFSLVPSPVQHKTLLFNHIQFSIHDLSKVHTKGRVHQNGIVELSRSLSDVNRFHLLKAAQWVTLWHQLRDGPLVQGARNEQDDVINHIAVPVVTRKEERSLYDPFIRSAGVPLSKISDFAISV